MWRALSREVAICLTKTWPPEVCPSLRSSIKFWSFWGRSFSTISCFGRGWCSYTAFINLSKFSRAIASRWSSLETSNGVNPLTARVVFIRDDFVIIFKKGSSMCRKCCSGQHSKNLTIFCMASFLSKACSTFLLSLSCAKQTAMESNAVTDQSSSSSSSGTHQAHHEREAALLNYVMHEPYHIEEAMHIVSMENWSW